MRSVVRSLMLCAACWGAASAQGCQAASPAGKGAADAALQDAAREDGGAEADSSASCAADGESCERSACCDDLACLSLSDGPLTCHAACDEGADCGSGCCVDVRVEGAASRRLCGDEAICFPNGCEAEGRSCGADAPCCAGLVCVDGARPESRNGCRARCERHEDCDSGCCVPFSGDESGFCDDALYCTCLEPGDACAGTGRSCCEGARCARFGEDAFSCLPTCESSEDCDGNCCSPIEGGPDVCAPFPC